MCLEVDFSSWQVHLEEKGVAGGVTAAAKSTATKLESGKHTICVSTCMEPWSVHFVEF